MTIIKCISITREFDDLAKDHHLSWTEASRIGMGILLADLGVQEYNGNLNQSRKIVLLNKRLEEVSQELSKLKEQK